MSTFRLALIQLSVGANKASNLARASEKIAEASKAGAKVVSLPECFNSPYGTQHFPEYAEPIPSGQSCDILSKAAKDHGIFLIGGTIPERDGDKLFNTCTIWSPTGDLISTYRKMHLFDIDIPGKITFKESDALTGGNDFVSFSTPWTEIGIGICYVCLHIFFFVVFHFIEVFKNFIIIYLLNYFRIYVLLIWHKFMQGRKIADC